MTVARLAPSGLRRCGLCSGRNPARTEGFDIPGLEFRQPLPDGFGGPISPRDLRELSCNFAIEALSDLSCRYAADDGVGRHVAGDHGARCQNGAVAHLDARHDDDRMPDPDIV